MKKLLRPLALVAASVSFALVSCQDDDHDHAHHDGDHDHEHADHDHGEEGHDHDHDHDHGDDGHAAHEPNVAGPNGGRVLMGIEPHVEFLVTEDRKVTLTFVDDDLKPVALAEQTATVIAGDRSAPTRLSFTKVGEQLVSDGVLPQGNDFPTVVQLKTTPDAAPVLEKFNLNLADCPTCDQLEYACTCDHSH